MFIWEWLCVHCTAMCCYVLSFFLGFLLCYGPEGGGGGVMKKSSEVSERNRGFFEVSKMAAGLSVTRVGRGEGI